MTLAKAQGKPTARIQKQLDVNPLYQMEQEGLAINLLEGVKEEPSLMNTMVFRNNKWVNEFTMGSGSYLGKKLANNFSLIDTQGRYALTQHYMKEGMTLSKAVHEANGLFADMDQMAPEWIELADKYGGAKFLKWFTYSTPMLLKLAKNNPMKTLTIGALLYAIQVETDTNFTTVNPIEATADFAGQTMELEFLNAIEKDGVHGATKKLAPYILPKPYMDMYNYIDYDDYKLIFKNRPTGERRGPVQELVESTIGYGKED